jgi:glyoxylase-like metal-dependent hydrolase (beta-lactamase superfamily II)
MPGSDKNRIRIGDVEVFGLAEAHVDPAPWPLSFLYPGTPLEAIEPYRQRFPEAFSRGESPDASSANFTCYLLRSRGQTVLVDAGIGGPEAPTAHALGTRGQLPQRLRDLGVEIDSISLVVLTHLHPDHIGWTTQRVDGRPRPTFPRARYLVHQADWDTWQSPDVRKMAGGFEEFIQPLADAGVLDLTAGEKSLNEELSTLHTPGHTPGSQSLLIRSGAEQGLIVGDALGHPMQVSEPDWLFGFDMHKDVAVQTRHRLLDLLESSGMTFGASHFPEPSFGKVVRLEGKRYWQAV